MTPTECPYCRGDRALVDLGVALSIGRLWACTARAHGPFPLVFVISGDRLVGELKQASAGAMARRILDLVDTVKESVSP